jgi:hypothetical protein
MPKSYLMFWHFGGFFLFRGLISAYRLIDCAGDNLDCRENIFHYLMATLH